MINRRHGFTLGETLIALGIIGVLAAILLPFVLKAKPDDNKIMYLKAYDTLTSNIHSLASNTSLFAFSSNLDDKEDKDAGAQIDCERLPFLNDSMPINSGDYSDDSNKDKYSGETKFCNLLAESFGINNANCKKDDIYQFNAENFNKQFSDNITFTLKNGMQFYVTQPVERSIDFDNNTATYQRDIYVDINGDKGPNCIYNSASCQKPDRFKFEIFADGELIPADPMGKMYIKGRRNFLRNDKTPKGNVNLAVNKKAIKSLKYYKEADAAFLLAEIETTLSNDTVDSSKMKFSDAKVSVYSYPNGFDSNQGKRKIEDNSILNSIALIGNSGNYTLNDAFTAENINNISFNFGGLTRTMSYQDNGTAEYNNDKKHYKVVLKNTNNFVATGGGEEGGEGTGTGTGDDNKKDKYIGVEINLVIRPFQEPLLYNDYKLQKYQKGWKIGENGTSLSAYSYPNGFNGGTKVSSENLPDTIYLISNTGIHYDLRRGGTTNTMPSQIGFLEHYDKLAFEINGNQYVMNLSRAAIQDSEEYMIKDSSGANIHCKFRITYDERLPNEPTLWIFWPETRTEPTGFLSYYVEYPNVTILGSANNWYVRCRGQKILEFFKDSTVYGNCNGRRIKVKTIKYYCSPNKVYEKIPECRFLHGEWF